ncbi:MAG: hypothetical protein ACKOEO_20980, partial [Planctomycetaceae bacterium]
PVAPEYRDVPTWEEAIGCLSLRTPSEDHARRTENRYRRSAPTGGGRDGARESGGGGREAGRESGRDGGRGRDGDSGRPRRR